MKYLKFGLVFLVALLFASCQCPGRKKEAKKEEVKKEEVKEATPISKVIEEIEKPVEKPKVEEKKEEVKVAVGEEVPPQKLSEGAKVEKPEGEVAAIFENIYFNFDKYDLKQDSIEKLKKIGDYLKANPEVKILIEGHCDERGTREYNLVLGEQRALSARNFLINYGISPSRLYTVSYGEDNPADPRHCEEAWAKNRRCEFKIVK